MKVLTVNVMEKNNEVLPNFTVGFIEDLSLDGDFTQWVGLSTH